MYFKNWRMNLRLIAGVITAVLAIGSGIGALAAYTDYLPATRGFAKEVAKSETDSALTITTARIGNLQRESSETRLQINGVRRDILRNSRWTLAEKVKVESSPQTQQLLQTQLDQIDDDLRDVLAERDRLRIPSP
jgi:hypothetical protein